MTDNSTDSARACWHKEINEQGICKACGAKAAIKLDGLHKGESPSLDMPWLSDAAKEAQTFLAERKILRVELSEDVLTYVFNAMAAFHAHASRTDAEAHRECHLEHQEAVRLVAELRERHAKLVEAARRADWQQVVLNGGPPCFHIECGNFCLRAQRWDGHRLDNYPGHKFVSLAECLKDEGSDGA